MQQPSLHRQLYYLKTSRLMTVPLRIRLIIRLIMIVSTGTNLKPISGHIKLWKGILALFISTDISFNIVLVSDCIKSARIIINTLY